MCKANNDIITKVQDLIEKRINGFLRFASRTDDEPLVIAQNLESVLNGTHWYRDV